MTLRSSFFFLLALLVPSGQAQAEVPLPTPKDHYSSFDAAQAGLKLLNDMLAEADPAIQKMAVELAGTSPSEGLSKIPRAEAQLLIRSYDWKKWKTPLLEVFLHYSNVLDVIPPNSRKWTPIVHDGLLYFLDHIDEERLVDRFLDVVYLPQEKSGRGDRILQFASRTPTFQKIGQIMGRNTGVETDIQEALQTLENTVQTLSYKELLDITTASLGKETIETYDIKFADRVLAEASVGAVLRANLRMPGETGRREVVCKIVKPYVRKAITEEGTIIDGLTHYFSREHEFYQLGGMPVTEMFQDIRKSMTDEIKIEAEQRNLVRAAEYYKGNSKILIPHFYPFSTPQVTVMEFVRGEKISNAFKGDARQRAVMARRLSDALTTDVIFSKQEEALFHGDPHAGNVFHVLNDAKDPYRIALLDWGLFGLFPKPQRQELVQLMLGLQLNDTKRLRKYIGALIQGEVPTDPAKVARLDELIKETLQQRSKRSNFDTLGDLILRLGKEGYVLRFNIALFIKSQVTIAGILAGLDPTLKQDQYLGKRTGALVRGELPKRFLYTLWIPGWNSHSYSSMLSNEDIKDVAARNFRGWFH